MRSGIEDQISSKVLNSKLIFVVRTSIVEQYPGKCDFPLSYDQNT